MLKAENLSIMKKLLEIIPSNMSSALGWTLVHSVWQGIGILLIFSVLYYLFKSSVTRYWLGLGALGLQFLSAIATLSIVYKPASAIENFIGGNTNFANFLAQTSNFTFNPKPLSFLQQSELFLQNNLDLFVNFWFIGTALLLLRLVVGFNYVEGLKIQQVNTVSADIQLLLDNLLEKIQVSAPIKLLESARATVPMTIGWLKPVILLPVGIASGLAVKQLEAILAHEVAHIKRYDYLVNIFQNFVEILFFFHPATWFISAKVRDERENCCDDFAVEICGDSLVLAKALTQVASYQQQPRLAMAFGAKRQTFMERIKRIIGINDSKPLSFGNWSAVLGMILVVALGVVYAQKEVIKKDKKINKLEVLDTKENANSDETKSDFYFFEMSNKDVGVYKNNDGNIEKILVEGNELKGKELEKMKVKVEIFLKGKDSEFALVKGISKDEEFGVFTHFFNKSLSSDSASLEEIEAEMELLGKEMEKYGKQMEFYGKLMEEKYGRQMEKHGAEMEQISRKMQVPQKKIHELAIEIQEASLAVQKLEMKYDDKEMPADVKQKMKDLQKREQELEKLMRLQEDEMNKIEAEMRPFEQKINNLQSPMDSLGLLMDRYSKPMDSLGKIMDQKGKLLEKLAKEEEARFKQEIQQLSNFLMSENLIKDKKNYEIRVKVDKMLIDLEQQPTNVYDKVYNWLSQNMNKRLKLTEKDFSIRVKGDRININSYNERGSYNYSTGFAVPHVAPVPSVSPAPRAVPTAPTAPRNSYLPTPKAAPQPAKVSTPRPPQPPKVSQVWLTPAQRAEAVMGNSDAEFERNEEGKNTSIYANPVLLNGQPLDYSKFSLKSKGLLTLIKGNPISAEAVKIPFRLYLRRNGMIVYEKKSGNSNLTEVEISDILALSKPGDQLIINPTEKANFKAKRVINVML